jgi:hypothetical protein
VLRLRNRALLNLIVSWRESLLMFSAWTVWGDRDELRGLAFPGVYVLAISNRSLAGEPFSWRRSVVYVGMTCSVSGLGGRLRQFDDTIAGRRTSHGGADRMRFEFRSYNRLKLHLYVAVRPVRCAAADVSPTTLRSFGRVVRFEYECLATHLERFGRLPRFNDKSNARKYSHWKRDGLGSS